MKQQIKIIIAALVILSSGPALAQSTDINMEGKLDAVEFDSNVATIQNQIHQLAEMQNVLGDSGPSGGLLSAIGQTVNNAETTLIQIKLNDDLEKSRTLVESLRQNIVQDQQMLSELLEN